MSTEAAINPRATTLRNQDGAARCCTSPTNGALVQSVLSAAGINNTNRNVLKTVTQNVNASVTPAVRRNAWRRGRGSSWAAYVNASPPPRTGRASATPNSQVSPTSTAGKPTVTTGEGGERREETGTTLRMRLSAHQIVVTPRTPAPIHTPLAIVPTPMSSPGRALAQTPPMRPTARKGP